MKVTIAILFFTFLAGVPRAEAGFRNVVIHEGVCTAEDLASGRFTKNYDISGGRPEKDPRYRTVCVERVIESTHLTPVNATVMGEPLFDVLLEFGDQRRTIHCCGGHLMPRECPCGD